MSEYDQFTELFQSCCFLHMIGSASPNRIIAYILISMKQNLTKSTSANSQAYLCVHFCINTLLICFLGKQWIFKYFIAYFHMFQKSEKKDHDSNTSSESFPQNTQIIFVYHRFLSCSFSAILILKLGFTIYTTHYTQYIITVTNITLSVKSFSLV
jgi:hypothetical protein